MLEYGSAYLLILALQCQKQADLCDFQVSPVYIARMFIRVGCCSLQVHIIYKISRTGEMINLPLVIGL